MQNILARLPKLYIEYIMQNILANPLNPFLRLLKSLVCSCNLETEDTSHYLLHCHHFSNHRAHLLNSVKSLCNNFESMLKRMYGYMVTLASMKLKTDLS